MDKLLSTMVSILVPALPYLVLAGQKAVEEVGSEIGKATWESAQKVWQTIFPHLEKDRLGMIKRIAEALREDENDEVAKSTLYFVLRDVLQQHPEVMDDLRGIVNSSSPHFQGTLGVGVGVITGGTVNMRIGTVIQTPLASKTYEIREVYLDLRTPEGVYPTLRWIEKVSAAKMFLDPLANPSVVKRWWEPSGYNYDKIKTELLKAINYWVARGWELIETNLDDLWDYKQERRRTLGAMLGDFLPISGDAEEYKRIYRGAKFHIRRVIS
ncbi:hypothetical protein D6779_12140 [Candidatus Parcubacteria bacterium]|nr:MAG: hypothetical protein D6779_12140 [Candidatus Parcubacteria bacterium]